VTPSCWTDLGIEPTAEVGLIRKAYARHLKSIDPEADPAAFMRLREALDEAMFQARYELVPEDRYPEPAPWSGEGEVAQLIHDQPLESPPERTSLDAAMDSLASLLFACAEDDQPDPALLREAVVNLLSDRGMELIERADWVESWLAQAVADAIPRSDPIVGLVADHFGWTRREGEWDLHPDIAYVVARYKGLTLLDQLAAPDHPYHHAYLSLTSQESSLGAGALFMKRSVRQLLATIQKHAPEAETGLDPYRVALWRDRIDGPPGWEPGSRNLVWVAIALGVLQAIRLLLS
jgi:hypothetical protein